MALQGDLSSFALPDVLRLLSSTHKSGTLEVRNPPASGRLLFQQGQITGGEVSTSERASRPADVVFEMFRFGGGTFAFDDIENDGGPDHHDGVAVMEVLGEAEALVGQWAEVEAVVPSMDAVITMAAELALEEVTLRADQWRALASINGGTTVQAIATHCSLGDLDTSRLVKGLAEANLVDIAFTAEEGTESESAEEPALVEDPITPTEDLLVLHGEEGPVVLGEGDGRLLPEPLLDEVGDYQPGTYEPAGYEPAGYEPADYEHAAMDSSAPEITMGAVDGHSFESFEPAEDPTGPVSNVDVAPMASTPADDDRGSLLRFLSTVEP